MWTIHAKFRCGANLCMCFGSSSAFVHRKTILLRSSSCRTISSSCGCISGSPPAIETIGAPASSMAPTACSTGIRCLSSDAGWAIFPQPAHLRLQANSGSSSTRIGNFFLPRSRCSIR